MTFRVIYSFVLLGSTVIFLLEIFGSDFSADNVIDTKNYLQLASLILYGLFGFIAFSKSFFKRTKLYLVLFYSMFIILRVSYEWWTDTLSKILNLMILASLINMLLGPINIIAMTIIINILAMIRFFFLIFFFFFNNFAFLEHQTIILALWKTLMHYFATLS